MKKIVIFGNSGAGKSTLAKKLKDDLGLAYLDLDTLAWEAASVPVRKPLAASRKEIDAFLQAAEGWVIEGCYTDLLSYVTRLTDEVIVLNPGIEVCVQHCRKRSWEPHKYASKQEQDNNLPMLIDWVKQYELRDDEFSLKAHKALFESFSGDKREIN